jgi:hypothetical protein
MYSASYVYSDLSRWILTMFMKKALAIGLSIMTDYFLLIPLSYVFVRHSFLPLIYSTNQFYQGEYYSVTSELFIGLFFFPAGVGNMISSATSGYISDILVMRGKRLRGGVYSPEDRLKASWPGLILLLPMSVLGYGLTTAFVRGRLGVGLNLFWLFLNGLAVR